MTTDTKSRPKDKFYRRYAAGAVLGVGRDRSAVG